MKVTVNDRGTGSRSAPFAVPPSSRTWKVKDVVPAPASRSFPAAMSAIGMTCPAATAAPSLVSAPPADGVVTFTARKLFGGLSIGSANPKSATANTYAVPAGTVRAFPPRPAGG